MANNIPVSFKFGNLANLPATKSQGTLYITKDERAIYFDVSADTRIRVGDFQSFATLAELEAYSNPSTTALYYVEELNVLAKWDGSKYVQINKDTDTGATSIQTVGDGNAVTTASYDPATRKITLTKGVTFALPSDITSAIEALDLANTYDAKGAAATAKSEVIGQSGDAASANTIFGAKAYADNAATTAANGKDAAIAAAKKAGDDAQSDVDALELKVGEIPVGATAQTVTALAAELANAAEDNATAVANQKVASVSAGNNGIEVGGTSTAPTVGLKLSAKTGNGLSIETGAGEEGLYFSQAAAPEYAIVKDVDSGDYAAVYHLTKDGVNTPVAINIPKDKLVESGEVVENPAGKPAGTYIKLVLQNVAQPLYIDVSTLIEYVTGGTAADGMITVSVDGTTHVATAVLNNGTVTEAKLDSATQAKIDKAHEHSNKTVLDGITAEKVSAWDAAEQNAKDYADGLANNYDAAGAAATVKSEVIGASTDAKTANTVNGAKAFATDAAATAKSEVIGASTDAKTADTVNGAKAFATDAATTAKNDVLGNASTDTSSSKTIEGTRKYVDEQIQNGLSWGTF